VKSFSQAMREAVRDSDLDDFQVAKGVGVSAGYFSRFMRRVAEQWAKRLVLFMRVTGSLAPLQWLAEQMGCDVVQRDSRAAEVAALQARLAELQRGGRAVA
jgi:hypothetical protein